MEGCAGYQRINLEEHATEPLVVLAINTNTSEDLSKPQSTLNSSKALVETRHVQTLYDRSYITMVCIDEAGSRCSLQRSCC